MLGVVERLSAESGDVPLCVLTGNYTIPQLFARGVLVTPEWGCGSETAFLDAHPSTFLSTAGRVPLAWSQGIEHSARNSFPILIELKPGHKIRWLKQDPRSFAYVTLADVERLVFRSEREMKRFAGWRFENYEVSCRLESDEGRFEQGSEALQAVSDSSDESTDDKSRRLVRGVEPSEGESLSLDGAGSSPRVTSDEHRRESAEPLIPGHAKEPTSEETSRNALENELNVEPASWASTIEVEHAPPLVVAAQQADARRWAFHRAETIAGMLAAFVRLMPGTREWMEGVRAFGAGGSLDSSKAGPSGWIALVYRTLVTEDPIASSKVESLLLSVTVQVLLSQSMSDGWPARAVLDEIVATAKQHADPQGGAELIKQIEKWQVRAGDVLEQRVRALDLSDDPNKAVRRALMLLLLRGDLDALEQTPVESDGPLNVGRDVKALAICLAAIRYGLRGLPSRLKTGGRTGERALTVLGKRLVEKYARLMDLEAEVVGGALDVKYDRHGDLNGRWLVLCDGREFDSRRAAFDHELKILYEKAKILGFEPREDSEREKTLCLDYNIEGLSFLVRMSLIGSILAEKRIVRFWVEIVPQAEKGAGRSRRVIKMKWKKPDLQELLMCNGDADMHCRYALVRETQQLVVLTDQLFHTLDDNEYRMHLKVVSEGAFYALKSILPQ